MLSKNSEAIRKVEAHKKDHLGGGGGGGALKYYCYIL